MPVSSPWTLTEPSGAGDAADGHEVAEVDVVIERGFGALVDQAGADREAVRHDFVRGRQGQVDGLDLGLGRGIAADPAGVVFGREAERRTDHRADGQAVVEFVDEGHRRDRGGLADVAAVAAGSRADEGRADAGEAVAAELGVEIDDGEVDLDGRALESGHGRGVVDDDRRVAGGDARAREGAAHGLDAVFLQLEARGVGLAEGQRAGDAERERRHLNQTVVGVHDAASPWTGGELRRATGPPLDPVAPAGSPLPTYDAVRTIPCGLTER
jgi:hypothetical protein